MVSTVQEKPATDDRAEQASGVLLLPAHLFFVRSVELPPGIDAEELPSFVELSLEQMSPFALNQLYYGHYLPEGSSHVLIFAAYRKQLAVFEDEDWTQAELVLPDFASLLGFSPEGPTVAFLENELEVTAIFWSGEKQVPDRIVSRRRDAVSEEPIRGLLRRKLGKLPRNVRTLFFTDPRPKFEDKNLVFSLRGEQSEVPVRIARPFFWTMDIRDKTFLAATRRVQRQNRLIWGGIVAIFAAFLALAVFEVVLYAGSRMVSSREGRLHALQPEVERIMQEEELARRLEELGGERLLPFEMLAHLNQHRPASIYYTRVATDGLRSFEIEALTPRSQDVDRFQRALERDQALEWVEIRNLRVQARNQLSSFVVVGKFAEGMLTDFSAGSSPRMAEGVSVSSEEENEAGAADSPDEEETIGGNGGGPSEVEVPMLPGENRNGETES